MDAFAFTRFVVVKCVGLRLVFPACADAALALVDVLLHRLALVAPYSLVLIFIDRVYPENVPLAVAELVVILFTQSGSDANYFTRGLIDLDGVELDGSLLA